MGLRAWALAAALTGGLGLAAPAMADDASRVATAREVVELSGAADAADTAFAGMAPMIVQQSLAGGMSQDAATRFGQLAQEEFHAELPRLLDLAAAVYASRFTDQELNDMRDFYRSHTGQTLRAKTPELIREMQHIGEIIGQDAGNRAVSRLQQEMGAKANGS